MGRVKTDADRVDELFEGKKPGRKKRSEAGKPTPEPPPATDEGAGADPEPPPGSTEIFTPAEDQKSEGKFPPLPNLKRGFESIIETLFDEGLDVVEEFGKIEESLSIKGALTPGAVQAAANNTEDMARKAYRLYIVAKIEHDAYVHETEKIIGAIREAATDHLEQQKASKKRSKMITDADVTHTAAQLYPDEWQRVNNRRQRAKRMLEYIERLSSLAGSRCYTVARMLTPGKL